MDELVRVYNDAVTAGAPPRVSVAKYFRITLAAASARIYRARKRGLLSARPTRTVDTVELSGVVTKPSSPANPHEQAARRIVNMNPAERKALRTALNKGQACPQCGGLHTRACPRVKRIVYSSSGSVAEVEFFAPGVWTDEAIIWPEDLETDDDDDEQDHGDDVQPTD